MGLDTLDQQLILYTAPAGSPSRDALDLLAMLAAGAPAPGTTSQDLTAQA